VKIVIDLTSLSYHMTGIERYASCITEKMLEIDHLNEYVLVFRNEIYPIFKKFIDHKRVDSLILYGNVKIFFLQIILPLHLYQLKANRYVFFAFTSPLLFRKKGIYNTIHDMGAWDSADSMTYFQKLYWRITYKVSATASEKIITVSEFSKNRINSILHFPLNKISIAYSAVYEGVVKDYGHSFQDIQKKYKLPEKYIMTLSTLEPRKNTELLLKTFSDIQDKVDYDLVLVGRKGWKIDEILKKYNSKSRIHITGFVNDEHVSVIYKNALCFVFPSLYEGFGLPPIEALSLGIPVIASDAASIPEILRYQATYFKNNDSNMLSKLLIELDEKRETMAHDLDSFQKSNYSFDKSARKILKLLL